MVVTTGATSRAKFQSNHHHQQTNTQFLMAGCPYCLPTNSVKALKGTISHSMDLLTPSSPGGLPTLFLCLIVAVFRDSCLAGVCTLLTIILVFYCVLCNCSCMFIYFYILLKKFLFCIIFCIFLCSLLLFLLCFCVVVSV